MASLDIIKSQFTTGFFSTDPQDLQKYGQDWSGVLKPNPCAIAFPKSTDEVSKLLKLCTQHQIAVVPSGGRTGLSGGAVAANGELVLSLEKLNYIKDLDLQSLTLEVGAGAITQSVHEFCEPHALTWPVDFASKGSSCVGGNISTNAGGVRVIRYGNTRNWVLGLTVVLMNGEILKLNGALEKNNSGFDLRQAFIGSEGTLGVITEAILKLCPLPHEDHVGVGFFKVKNFKTLLKVFEKTRQTAFTLNAFECLTHECLEQVVKFGNKSPFVESEQGEVYALIEFEAKSEVADTYLEDLMASGFVLDGVLAQSKKEKQELWALRENVAEAVMNKSEVHQQDLSVPIKNLEPFVADIKNRYQKSYPEFEVFIFGHIGDGNLHVFIRKPQTMKSAAFHTQCEASDALLFELTQKYEGSVSAEHGIGVLKKSALSFTRSEGEIKILKKLKQDFDPAGLLNPGKIV